MFAMAPDNARVLRDELRELSRLCVSRDHLVSMPSRRLQRVSEREVGDLAAESRPDLV
jgi:hypothetical protein